MPATPDAPFLPRPPDPNRICGPAPGGRWAQPHSAPEVARLLCAALAVLAFMAAFVISPDPDYWWHLTAGATSSRGTARRWLTSSWSRCQCTADTNYTKPWYPRGARLAAPGQGDDYRR